MMVKLGLSTTVNMKKKKKNNKQHNDQWPIFRVSDETIAKYY